VKLDYLLLPSLTVDIRRPVVDIKMEGIPEVGISCLVDSGALHNRFDENLALAAGIDLRDAEPAKAFQVAGRDYDGKWSTVTLSIGEYSWDAPICFVHEWNRDFQLLGQEGFFRWFDVCFHAADEYLTLNFTRH